MFDIGFTELVLLAIVGLIVIGPEQLPDAIRTVGAWISKIRKSYNDIRLEVQQELHNETVLNDLREAGDRITRESNEIENKLRKDYEKLDEQISEQTSDEVKRANTQAKN